jgi:hypothetical protein
MPRAKSASKRSRLRKALTIAGVSLSVAGPASVSIAMPAPPATRILYDEEVSDVTLATFNYFDKENDLPSKGAGDGRMKAIRSRRCWACTGGRPP